MRWCIVGLGGVGGVFTDMIVSDRPAERAVLATVVRQGRRGAAVGVASRDRLAHLVVDLAHRVSSQAQGEAGGAAVAGRR